MEIFNQYAILVGSGTHRIYRHSVINRRDGEKASNQDLFWDFKLLSLVKLRKVSHFGEKRINDKYFVALTKKGIQLIEIFDTLPSMICTFPKQKETAMSKGKVQAGDYYFDLTFYQTNCKSKHEKQKKNKKL